MSVGFNRSRSATAVMTRWPEAFSRVVPEGDALAHEFRARVGEVLLHSYCAFCKNIKKKTSFFFMVSHSGTYNNSQSCRSGSRDLTCIS